jgi:superfamily II DNA helicase RecQ
MGRKKERVRYDLDSGGIRKLTDDEIKAVLRAADEIIAIGGRSMLAKILKGSKDKKVLEHGLNLCPTYGFYMELTLAEITNRIDWMIQKDYLEIEYRDRLPLLVFSEKGWDIEKENCTEELLQKFTILLEGKDYSFIQQLKDKNRGMILLFIEKIKQTGNARFIPILKAWKEIEYKKVQAEIQRVIDYLMKEGTIF